MRRRSGVRFVVENGPLCYPAKHYCTYKKLAGWKVSIVKGGKVLARGTTNRAGVVTLYAPPGRCTYDFSGLLDGRLYSRHGGVVPVLAGRIVPFYLSIG